ncbi:hypothetical protein [Mycobacterium angelicum]|uniref:Uncharacterized protein n=1 Tax=Mycobacterium angelicum TaxID=470074 RepID=A0A1W9ZXM2_MYCAN|nr:hypothetical protein [Mycobacterium angelicum]MCV7198475.1 hypothetical protein [Mycobacterium angelicum]ORA22435.1 hypothetical protein BST12_09760 [Mycobacterium angelicum]
MSIFRVEFAEGFALGNENVVLAVADRDGLRAFQSAVLTARMQGQAHFTINGINHQIVRQPGAAEVQLGSGAITWKFDDTKLAEIAAKNVSMINASHAVHHYIDYIHSPASTLVISVDEYV